MAPARAVNQSSPCGGNITHPLPLDPDRGATGARLSAGSRACELGSRRGPMPGTSQIASRATLEPDLFVNAASLLVGSPRRSSGSLDVGIGRKLAHWPDSHCSWCSMIIEPLPCPSSWGPPAHAMSHGRTPFPKSQRPFHLPHGGHGATCVCRGPGPGFAGSHLEE
jgi:hypothetical protein